MQIFTGTSGFSYPAWRGSFYPEKLPAKQMLTHYAGRLKTVEVNNTFYRMPKAEALAAWAATTPAGFRFAPKAPQQITHRQRLVGSADTLAHFWKTLQALGDKLGPALFQLPPFQRKDLPRLTDFLALMPEGARAAFEFRHASWFDDDVYAALAARGAALCVAEADDLQTPLIATTSWGYLRLRRLEYDEAALAAWNSRLREQAGKWTETYVYFKHEDAGVGPRLAARFEELAAAGG
jgi:uncharacterized protein YecE (DUF72 family)